MEGCVFCKIAEGKIPAYKVYEDKNFVAFLDIRPLNPAHVQVIPKKHYRWVFDVPNFGEYLEVVKKIGLAAIKELGAFTFSIATLGFDVEHAHVWVVPRYENDGHGGLIRWDNVKDISKEEMSEIAEKLSKAIKG